VDVGEVVQVHWHPTLYAETSIVVEATVEHLETTTFDKVHLRTSGVNWTVPGHWTMSDFAFEGLRSPRSPSPVPEWVLSC
jgi:hypothetical protein